MSLKKVLISLATIVFLASLAQAQTPAADDAAKKAALEAKKKEVDEQNALIMRQNAAMKKAVEDSNAAFARKDYAGALSILDAAIKADETHPAVVVMHTNRSLIFRVRGVEKFNSSIKAKDELVKKTDSDAARRDFHDAVGAALQAESAALVLAAQDKNPASYTAIFTPVLSAKAYAYQMRLKFDMSFIDQAKAAFTRYIQTETNCEERIKARLAYAKVLLDSGDILESGIEAEKVFSLDLDLKNPDALLQAGLGLTMGSSDVPVRQRGASYLSKFLTVAPAAHPGRKDAQDTLEYLKAEGIVPK